MKNNDNQTLENILDSVKVLLKKAAIFEKARTNSKAIEALYAGEIGRLNNNYLSAYASCRRSMAFKKNDVEKWNKEAEVCKQQHQLALNMKPVEYINYIINETNEAMNATVLMYVYQTIDVNKLPGFAREMVINNYANIVLEEAKKQIEADKETAKPEAGVKIGAAQDVEEIGIGAATENLNCKRLKKKERER